jgi:radical SAM protein with 4Fe4S-binding SPASM domain
LGKNCKQHQKIIAEDIPIRFGIVATTTNQKTLESTARWIENDFCISLAKPYDVVRSCGRGANTDIIPWDLFLEQHIRLKPNFQNINEQSFQHSLYGNVCWANEVCILPNGDVAPCKMEQHIIQGNIAKQRLRDIILGIGGDKAQRLTKDKVAICSDCEYRYACWECRAMSHQLDSEKFTKPLTCMYNPHTGVWEKPPNNLIELFPNLLPKPS